jgi:hypothetical protein
MVNGASTMLGTLLRMLTNLLPGDMPHLSRLVIERPDLLVDHAMAYVALTKREIELAKRALLRRAVAGAIALASALAFLVLAGVSLMLCATTQPPADAMWVLWAVPGAMLAVMLISVAVAWAKNRDVPNAHSLSAQFSTDLHALRTAMEPRT